MIFPLLYRTIRYLKLKQIVYQIRAKLFHPRLEDISSPTMEIAPISVNPIVKYTSLSGNAFSFLNICDSFKSWNQTENGMLWAYNLNYMDWLGQETICEKEGCEWIDKFIEELPNNNVGLDPYPIALRSINWIKFLSRHPMSRSKKRLDSLYSQLLLLEKKLEYRLLGNHLLEDSYALYIGAAFFREEAKLKKYQTLLYSQLQEQILPDGAHFEQSPMYHCILLDRLLDCINIRKTNELVAYAERMLGHLESMCWEGQNIPLLNDSAKGIAPEPRQLFDYAKRLGLSWVPIKMKECGYRKLIAGGIDAIIDVGNITASYQPGHTHADCLNYVLHINGNPVVVDTGVSTYNPTERRQYERSTPAHNCVSVGGKDSSEVWGGFRVGKRCEVQIINDGNSCVVASHNGYDKPCIREFQINQQEFIIIDKYKGNAVSYIHLAPGVLPDVVQIEHAEKVDVCEDIISEEYNLFMDTKCLKIYFNDYCKYKIIANKI